MFNPSSINTTVVEFNQDYIPRKAKSASYRVRELVHEATKSDTNISSVYKDTLRCIRDLFSQFHYIDYEGKVTQVKAIHANPERPIAKMVQQDNLVLPIISVGQPRTVISPERRKYLPLVVEESFWVDKIQKAVRVVSLVPKPIDIVYSISIWSKYKEDLDQITEQIHSTFNPGYELQTTISNNTKAFLEEEVDDSTVAVGDKEDRILRRKFTVMVQTYVPSPKFIFSSTGKLEKFNAEAYLVSEIEDE